jgi:hypothetical protein
MLINSPPLVRRPMENITTATKKLSNGTGLISKPSSAEVASLDSGV